MAKRKSNRAARKALGLPYKLSKSNPFPWVFIQPLGEVERRWVPDHLQNEPAVVVKYEPRAFCGMLVDGYGHYKVSQFYPACVAQEKAL